MPGYYYPDIAFLVNFILDYILLFLTGRIRRRKAGWKRLCFSAAAGSLITVFLTISGAGRILRMAGILFAGVVMCRISFGRRGIKGDIAALFFCTFIMGGMLYVAVSFVAGTPAADGAGSILEGIVPEAVLLAFLTVAAAGIIFFCIVVRKKEVDTPVYPIRFLIGDIPYCCRGFLDTGNGLYEPFGKKPVLLLVSPDYKKPLEEFIAKFPEKTRYVPYRAIGRSDGMLVGAELKELVISKGQEEIQLYSIPAAYTEISGGMGAYQAILHPDFFP